MGRGYNMNINFNVPSGKFKDSKVPITSKEYLPLYTHLVLPTVNEFKPDFIIVCCGFDACDGDPLGDLCLEP